MDPQMIEKQEVNVIKSEHDLFIDVKIEEHPINTDFKEVTVDQNDQQIIKQYVCVIKSEHDDIMDFKIEEHPIKIEPSSCLSITSITPSTTSNFIEDSCEIIHSKYQVEQQRIYNGEKPCQCNVCGIRFSQKSYLEKHMFKHTGEKPYHCSVCGESFDRKDTMIYHDKMHKEKPNLCKDCGKCFAQKSFLEKHMMKHIGEKSYIGSCLTITSITPSTTFKSIEDSGEIIHSKAYQIEQQRIYNGEKPCQCIVCGIRFSQKSFLEKHMIKHTGKKPYQCSICGASFARRDTMIYHDKMHKEKPNLCNDCGKCFAQKSDLEKHMMKHTGEKPYQYRLCGKGFVRRDNMVNHDKMHKEKSNQCNSCGKCFDQKSYLEKHMIEHTDEKPYQCSHCSMCFAQRGTLERHASKHIAQEGEHENYMDVKLEECPKNNEPSSFPTVTSISPSTSVNTIEDSGKTIHSKDYQVEPQNKHDGEKPCQCIICGIHFATKSYLEKHRIKHNVEKPYQCSQCGKCYAYRDKMLDHCRMHSVKPNQCNICGKCFAHKNHLEKHTITHTEEKPYHCIHCGMCFARRYTMERHASKHVAQESEHENYMDVKIEEWPITIEPGSFPTVTSFSPSTSYNPIEDSRKTIHSKDYQVEQQKKHEGEKPCQCNICGIRFSKKSYLEKHREKHPEEKPYTMERHASKHISKESEHENYVDVKIEECPIKIEPSSFSTVPSISHRTSINPKEDSGKTIHSKDYQVEQQKNHDGEKPCQCNICGVRFAKKSYLEKHSVKHNEKPYQFSQCGMYIIQKR